MSEAEVTQNEIDERPVVTEEPDVVLVDAEPEDGAQGELIKFALLAVIMLGTALVIGLLRPYIFEHVVPAVLGENQPAATIINTEAEAETLKPEVEDENEAAADEAETPGEVEEAEEAGEGDTEASEEPVNPEDLPTAVPPKTHTVQPGETLTAIARQHNSTVQAIVAANNITNPNRVTAGTVLTIPDGSE